MADKSQSGPGIESACDLLFAFFVSQRLAFRSESAYRICNCAQTQKVIVCTKQLLSSGAKAPNQAWGAASGFASAYGHAFLRRCSTNSMHAIHGNAAPSQSVFEEMVEVLVTNDTPSYNDEQGAESEPMQSHRDQAHCDEGPDEAEGLAARAAADATATLDHYPQRRDVLVSERLACQFPSCGARYKRSKYLIKHLASAHLIKGQDIANHWIGQEHKRERKNTRDAQLGDCEIAYVRPCVGDDDTVDEENFYCITCEQFLPKRKCLLHLTKDHDVDAEMVKGWACVHDAKLLRNAKPTSKYYKTYANLTRAFDDLALLGAPELAQHHEGVRCASECDSKSDEHRMPAATERAPVQQCAIGDTAVSESDTVETLRGEHNGQPSDFGTQQSQRPIDALRNQAASFVNLVESLTHNEAGDSLNEHELNYMTSTIRLFCDQLERVPEARVQTPCGLSEGCEPTSVEQRGVRIENPDNKSQQQLQPRAPRKSQPQKPPQQQEAQPPHRQDQHCEQTTRGMPRQPTQQIHDLGCNTPDQQSIEQQAVLNTDQPSSNMRIRLLLNATPKPPPAQRNNVTITHDGVADGDARADDAQGEHHATQQIPSPISLDVEGAANIGAGEQSAAAAQVRKRQRWSKTLPTVSIRPEYLELAGPLPSKAGERISPWPIKFKQDLFVPSGLNRFLTSLKQVSGDQLSDTTRGVARFFNMLEVDGQPLESSPMLDDPGVLVAFYMSDIHHDLFKLKILDPGHPWTSKFISALKVLCELHISNLNKEQLLSNDKRLGKHKVAIEQLLLELKAGFTKRVKIAKEKSLIERKGIDRKRIATFVVDVFKEAVRKAMIVLQFIHSTYSRAARMPSHIIAEATTCIVGILALNGFFGRNMEWEILSFEHIKEQFDKCLDFIVCSVHKTSSTYGDLAKWFAPGSIIAALRYMELPRRAHVVTFLCPAFASTRRVSVPTYLRRFSELYLSECEVFPTVNLLRKWYHTVLNRMVSDKARLQALFQSIDPHRGTTQEKHYVLTGPEDDARLAKQMVAAMMGDTVPWPSQEALSSGSDVVAAFEERITDKRAWMTGAAERDGTCSAAEGEDELEWFEFAQYFGIPNPCPALQDEPPASQPSSESDDSMTTNLDAALSQAIEQDSTACEGSQLVALREHAEMPQSDQLKRPMLCDTQDQASAKRGRQSKFSDQQKDWVAFHCIAFLTYASWAAGHAPPAVYLKEILDKGKSQGLFDDSVTVDQVRHISRSWRPAKLKGRITVCRIEPPAAGGAIAFIPIGEELVLEAHGYATLSAVLKFIAPDIGACESDVENFEAYSLSTSSGGVELGRVDLSALACCHGAIAFHT